MSPVLYNIFLLNTSYCAGEKKRVSLTHPLKLDITNSNHTYDSWDFKKGTLLFCNKNNGKNLQEFKWHDNAKTKQTQTVCSEDSI